MKTKLLSGVLAFSLFAAALVPGLTSAQEAQEDADLIAELQQQVQQLVAQVQQLTEQIQALNAEQAELQIEVEELRLEARQLREGVRGEDVELLQEVLSTDPEIYPEGLVTGYFGPLTRAAVTKFQAKAGINGTGEVNVQTRAKINQLLEEGAGNSGNVPPGLLIAPGIQRLFGDDDSEFIPPGLGGTPPGQQNDEEEDEDGEDENGEEDDEENNEDEDEENGDENEEEEEDTTDPTISSLSPADNATEVALDTNLTMTFSETVVADTGDITVHQASDDSVVETIAVTSTTGTGSDTITAELSADLEAATEYYVMVDSAILEDEAGNDFAGIADETTWNFTTTE